MSSTNKTSNLQLSQFVATDTPAWLVDYNGDMAKIDDGVGRVEVLAETASTQAVGVANSLQTTNQTVATLSGQIANVQTQATGNTNSINGINQRLGNSDISGVGDGTVTGAINALNAGGSTSSLEWKVGNRSTGTTPISIPSTAKELLIVGNLATNNDNYLTTIIPYNVLSSTKVGFNFGGSDDATNKMFMQVKVSTATAEISKAFLNGSDVISTSSITIYYR